MAFSFVFLLSTLATAQTAPELMVTWKSNNYAPANFQGKILPIDGSKIDMALELIDSGKIANLSGSEIHWLVNGEDLKSGVGLKNISFTADGFRGNQTIDITVKNYGGGDLEKIVTIPLARPEVVIGGGGNMFEALLYFFNVTDVDQIRINWSANGQRATGLVKDPTKINLDLSQLPAGSEVSLKVEAQNTLKPLEIASQSIQVNK